MGNYIYKKGTVAPLVVDTLEPITCASPSLKEQIERIELMSKIASKMIPDTFPDTCESVQIGQPLEKKYVISEMPDSPNPQLVEPDIESIPETPQVPAVKRAQIFTFIIDDKKRDRSSCSICTWSDESEENKLLYKMMKEMML